MLILDREELEEEMRLVYCAREELLLLLLPSRRCGDWRVVAGRRRWDLLD